MSETSFFLFHQWIAGIEIILYAVCFTALFRPFMAPKAPGNSIRKRCAGIFLIYTAAYPVCMLPHVYGWMHLLLVIALLTAFSGWLGLERKLIFLLGMIFHCIRNLSMLILRSIDYLSSDCFLQKADTAEKVFRSAARNYLFIQSLQLLLFSLMLRTAVSSLLKKGMKLHTKELIYLLLTPATGILFVNIILRLLVIADEHQVIRLYDQFPVFIGLLPVIALLFYLGILAAVASCQRVVGLQEERKKYFVMEQQLSAMQKRMEEVEQFHSGIRRMRHEMRNHLTNIKGLAESGCYRDMEEYIGKMEESMNAFELTIRTGNPVTDVIVNDRQKTAVRQGISFQSDFSYPASASYNAYDIGIILANLLQNALEACGKAAKEPKYIFLSGRQKHKFFVIQVRNPFEGEIVFDRNTRLPSTTKNTPASENPSCMHGIGLSNVKAEAEKYGGSMDIQIEENEFCVTVLLQEPAAERRENDYQ